MKNRPPRTVIMTSATQSSTMVKPRRDPTVVFMRVFSAAERVLAARVGVARVTGVSAR
jgi:hypothetical protein